MNKQWNVCAVLVAVLAMTGMASASSYLGFDAGQDLSNWQTDRYDSSIFAITDFDGDARLQVGLDAADVNPGGNSWRNWQGKKLYFSDVMADSPTSVSIDMYIPQAWTDGSVARNASVWLNGWDGTNDQLAWTIVALSSDGEGNFGWKVWIDEEPGAWNSPNTLNTCAGWHTLSMTMVNDTVEYAIDGTLLGVDDDFDSTIVGFKEVILQGYNFGETYSDIYFDNLTATAPVPEPMTAMALFTGCAGLARYIRKRNKC